MTRYAYRLETRKVKEPDFKYDHATNLASPENVADFAKSLQDSDVEKFLVLHLSGKNRLICIQIYPGTIGSTVVYPREVIKHSLLSGATAMILVHNHPSGSGNFSNHDIRLTTQMSKACALIGITLFDHILIHDNKYTSMRSKGEMP